MDRFDAMTAFVRVVDAGSLSAAARLSSKSLTAMSRLISKLEHELGVQLLRRTTRSLALTEEGQLFYGRSKAILGEMEELELALSSGQIEPSGRLRVSAPALIGRLLLAPLISKFLARYPSLAIDLMLMDRAVNLIEEDIHVSLRVGHLPDSDLIARRLGEIHLVVCAAPSYIERRDAPVTPGDLKRHDCLAFSDVPGPVEWQFRRGGRTQIIRVMGRVWANNLDALVSAARDGVGIVRAPSWYVAEDLRTGALKALLTEYQREPTPVHLLFQHSRRASPKLRAFVDYLAASWARASAQIPQ